MLSKTSISALRALVHLAQQDDGSCLSPRRIAEALDESPTYMAKALRHLVKARILRAEKGVHGGVRLGLHPSDITLLAIVEACQGVIVGDFCQSSRPASTFCNFHKAALELHNSITGVLARWTLAHMIEKPHPSGVHGGGVACVMTNGLLFPEIAQPARSRIRIGK